MIKVKLFLRPKRAGAFSIEKLFKTLLPYLKDQISADLYTIKNSNYGLFKRLAILLEVKRQKGEIVNHITGDVNYIALVLPSSKTILTIHDIDSFVRKRKIQNAVIRFFWLYLPLKKVKYITVISEASKARLLEEFSFLKNNNIHVIPNCVTINFNVEPKEFNQYEPVILQIGTKDNKNLPNLINAIAPIRCRLLIVGKITYDIKALLERANISFEVFENIPDEGIMNLYRQCDIVTLISKYEGFGLPILEANACGRVVITSNISSMPEVAGDSALLVDPNNIKSIRQGIQTIIDTPSLREELINKGMVNVKKYLPETIATKYIKLYEQINAPYETKDSSFY